MGELAPLAAFDAQIVFHDITLLDIQPKIIKPGFLKTSVKVNVYPPDILRPRFVFWKRLAIGFLELIVLASSPHNRCFTRKERTNDQELL